MDMLSFLTYVLPDGQNKYVGMYQDRPKHVKQFTCASIVELAHRLLELSAGGFNTYFALSGYKDGWHDAGGLTHTIRTIDNTQEQKVIWLDIDVNKDSVPSYTSKEEALQALAKFVSDTGMPAPTVVDSGFGIHVLWVLSETITYITWREIAYRLLSLCNSYGLKVDSTQTTNVLSSPRPVGSWNIKPHDSAEVRLLSKGTSASVEELRGVLPQVAVPEIVPASVPIYANVPGVLKDPAVMEAMQGASVLSPPKQPLPIIKGCRQIREAGKASYITWFNMMVVLSHCERGIEAARILSKQDPRFSEDEFITRFGQATNLSGGPTACATFAMYDETKCAGCPHTNIRSPIVLGLPNSTAATIVPTYDKPPTPVPIGDTTMNYPMFTHPSFEMVHNDGLYILATDDKGTVNRRRVLRGSIYFASAQIYEASYAERETIYVLHRYVDGVRKQIQLSASDTATSASMRKWFVNNQIMPTAGNEKEVTNFMLTFLSHVQNDVPQIVMRDYFGWTKPSKTDGKLGFVIGDSLLLESMPATRIGLSAKLDGVAEKIHPFGSIEEWKKIPAFYSKYNMMWAQFGLCLSFGAPLINFAPGNARNGLVHFWSPESGVGKTALQSAINSVWGKSDELSITPSATVNARYAVISKLRNLPVCINEITLLEDAVLSEMLFTLSEGTEKERLNADSSLKSSGHWNTITVTSANSTVVDKMLRYAPQRSGELKRVLEVRVPPILATREDANELTRIINTNYGVVGPVYMQHLLDKGYINKMANLLETWVSKESKGSDERYWENIIAVALMGGSIAKSMGLIDFDISAIKYYAFGLLNEMRNKVATSLSDGASDIAEFLNNNLRNTLIVTGAQRTEKQGTAGPVQFDPYVKRFPTNDLLVRIELDTQTTYISTTAFKKWCKDANKESSLILADLAKAGMYDPYKKSGSGRTGIVKKRMASGGIMGLPDSSAIACYEIVGMAVDTLGDE